MRQTTVTTRRSLAALRIGLLLSGLLLALSATSQADPAPANPAPTSPAEAERGRMVFNGKGVCAYCHGVDGRLDQMPPLLPETAAIIAGLDPKPANLRQAAGLKLKTDKERFRAIREGHPGTGMLPDTNLTDQEIEDALAYLAVLRGPPKTPRKPR